MDWLFDFVDIVLHLDRYLDLIVKDYGTWTYGILILVVFVKPALW